MMRSRKFVWQAASTAALTAVFPSIAQAEPLSPSPSGADAAAMQVSADQKEQSQTAGASAESKSSATTDASPSASAAPEGEVIYVTARRRSEALQEVPLAITAFTGEELRRSNIERMENLSIVTPGLSISPNQSRANAPGFAIRGQRQDAGFLTNDPSVGIYVAEAVQARNFGLSQALFDLESVQVLKGPQGTLFGRNTTGGAILFQPNRPNLDEFGGYIGTRIGNFGRFDIEGVLNVPISSSLAVRFAANRTHNSGYVHDVTLDRDFNDQNANYGRAILLFKPSVRFSNTSYVDYVKIDEHGSRTRLSAVNPATASGQLLAPVLASQNANLGFWEVESSYPNLFSRGKNFGITNVTEYEVTDGLKLKNIFNFRDIKSRDRTDYDGTTLSRLDLDLEQTARQYTNEIQAQGESFSGRLKWIIGGYYFRESGHVITLTSVNGGTANPRTGEAVNLSKSLFAQGDFDITKALTLTLGGRYTWDKRSIDQRLVSASTGACLFCAADSAKFKAPTYTATLNWEIDDDRILYITNRSGYRSGGFSASANNAAALTPFKPEKVTDTEIGFKADWHIGQAFLRTNIAAYHSDYKQIQRTVIRLLAGIPVTTIFNAASGTIEGGEIEVDFRPVKELQLLGSLGLVYPKYKKFDEVTATGTIDRSDNEFAFVPHETYRLGFRWNVPVDSSRESVLTLGADYYHQSSTYQAEVNETWNYQPGYGLLSARAEWANPVRNLTVALWGRNLTNKKYYISAGDSYRSLGYIYRGLSEPRTYGIEARYKF